MSAAPAPVALADWRELLAFWFEPAHVPLWFEVHPAFDARIRERFTPLIEAAVAGGLDDWEDAPDSCLALLIAIDQLPRNAWRGTPRAFCGDERALAVAERALARGLDAQMPPIRRRFFYLPFEHSESLADQHRCCALFARMADEAEGEDRGWTREQLRYADRHREIIERFGRFPHRNAILDRPSSAAEVEFLKEPMSSF